jgi:hypothetical protein
MISFTLAMPKQTHDVKCACCGNKATWCAGFSDHHYRRRLPSDGLYSFDELPSCWWCLRTVGYTALARNSKSGVCSYAARKAWPEGIPPGAKPTTPERKDKARWDLDLPWRGYGTRDRTWMPWFVWEDDVEAAAVAIDKACCLPP